MEPITINGVEYKIKCSLALVEKMRLRDFPALAIELIVFKDGKRLKWKDFKGTYEAQKISDNIRRKINGEDLY